MRTIGWLLVLAACSSRGEPAARKADDPARPAAPLRVEPGAQPIPGTPAVEVTADEIRWLGKRVATPAELAAGAPPGAKIGALLEAGAAHARQAPAANPVALCAIDAAPMRVVNRVLSTMAAAGIELVPARDRQGWKLLRPLERLPIVPVPAADRLDLSILVTADAIWVGITRVNEFEEVRRRPDGHDLEKLQSILAQHRSGELFLDRTDLDVAGEDTVPYGDVASILEIAGKVGFVYARVVEPAALSARPQL